jgi:hypothetical protein
LGNSRADAKAIQIPIESAAENDAKRHNEVSARDIACAAQVSVAPTVNAAAPQDSLIRREDDASSRLNLAIAQLQEVDDDFLFGSPSVFTFAGNGRRRMM